MSGWGNREVPCVDTENNKERRPDLGRKDYNFSKVGFKVGQPMYESEI